MRPTLILILLALLLAGCASAPTVSPVAPDAAWASPTPAPVVEVAPTPSPVPAFPSPTALTPIEPDLITFVEAPISLRLTEDYALVPNGEKNRRGSFASYDIRRADPSLMPQITEIQFFDEASVRDFTELCAGDMCFEGDYHDTARFLEEKAAFEAEESTERAIFQRINGVPFLVATYGIMNDYLFIREYSTYVGDIRVDLWIFMENESQIAAADELFHSLDFRLAP